MYYTHKGSNAPPSHQPLINGLGNAYEIAADALRACQNISRSTSSIMRGSGSKLGETMSRSSKQATKDYETCVEALTKAFDLVQSRQIRNKFS